MINLGSIISLGYRFYFYEANAFYDYVYLIFFGSQILIGLLHFLLF